MNVVRDAVGVTHWVRTVPETFFIRSGGLPGQTFCVENFFYRARGPSSCPWPGAKVMDQVYTPVDCMACLVAQGKRR